MTKPASGDEWYLRPIAIIVRRVMAGAAGDALREVARDLDAAGVAPEVVDRVRERAATYDGIRVVRVKAQ